MTTKNPFEIRMDILTMAKEYMDAQYDLQLKFFEKSMDQLSKSGNLNIETMQNMMPKMYSVEDLQKKAQEFYSFVAKKD
jgi:hypothetical protein